MPKRKIILDNSPLKKVKTKYYINNDKYLIGVILKKVKNKYQVALCEFIRLHTYEKYNGIIIRDKQTLEINNINKIFNSKREFMIWKKKNKDIKIISLNNCMQCKFYDYIKKNNIIDINGIKIKYNHFN